MSDFELRSLHRQALDDPSLRPKFLELSRKMGKDPKDDQGLGWEEDYLREQQSILEQKQKDFSLRYIENFIRKHSLPNLIITTTYVDEIYQDILIVEDEDDLRYLDICPEFSEENSTILRYLKTFYCIGVPLRFQIVNGIFKIYSQHKDSVEDIHNWKWIEVNELSSLPIQE